MTLSELFCPSYTQNKISSAPLVSVVSAGKFPVLGQIMGQKEESLKWCSSKFDTL